MGLAGTRWQHAIPAGTGRGDPAAVWAATPVDGLFWSAGLAALLASRCWAALEELTPLTVLIPSAPSAGSPPPVPLPAARCDKNQWIKKKVLIPGLASQDRSEFKKPAIIQEKLHFLLAQ